MLYFVLAQLFSVLIYGLVGRPHPERRKDLQILILRQQLLRSDGFSHITDFFAAIASTQSHRDTAMSVFSLVETAVAQHLVGGYAEGTFRPNGLITRVQLSKIVALARGWDLLDQAATTCRDVPPGSTFVSYVETAAQTGILNGYDWGPGCGEFRPGNEALRGRIAKIVYNALLDRR